MKGLKIIPRFLVLMGLSYAGLLFVQANNDEIVVKFGSYQFPSMPVGLIVLSSIFIGMVICGVLCTIEILALYVQNRKLKKKIKSLGLESKPAVPLVPQDVTASKATGRFT